MIETMLKVTLVAPARQRVELVTRVQELGVLHLTATPAAGSAVGADRERTEALRADLEALATTLHVAEGRGAGPEMAGARPSESYLVAEARALAQAQHSAPARAAERRRVQQVERSLAGPGRFRTEDLRALTEAGLRVVLYRADRAEARAACCGNEVFPVGRLGAQEVLALVTPDPRRALPLEELRLPDGGWESLDAALARGAAEDAAAQAQVRAVLGRGAEFAGALAGCRTALAFEDAQGRVAVADELAWLTGFCPVDRLVALRELATRSDWALWSEAPTPEDAVPTLLRPRAGSGLFHPVLDLLGVLPGYRELDANLALLGFFACFFAMLVGDAGYGLLLGLGAAGAAWRRPAWPRGPLMLLGILAAATVVWGAMSGMWFGIAEAGTWPVLRALVVPGWHAFAADPAPVMRLCLQLGTLHLVLAHAWLAVRHRSLRSVGEFGWMLAVFGMYLASEYLLLKRGEPTWFWLLLGTGTVLIVLFGEQSAAGFRSGLRRGVENLPLTVLGVVGVLSDVISYVRLFAVGLAGKEIAVACNELVGEWTARGVVGWLPAAAIAAIGHGGILALAGLSVLVHGVRLNLLEFSRHLDLSWSGLRYDPLRMYSVADPERARTAGQVGAVSTGGRVQWSR